jgi:hypothetical protein
MMRKSALLALVLVLGAALPADAAPLSVPAADAPAAASLVEPVHGCHRSAQDSINGWHRHVGPYCRAVRSGPGERNRYSNCRTKCQYIGPIKQCRRVCGY